jgi:hypothetical protein
VVVPVAYTMLDDAKRYLNDAKRYLNIALVWAHLRKPNLVAPPATPVAAE